MLSEEFQILKLQTFNSGYNKGIFCHLERFFGHTVKWNISNG